MQDLAPFIEWDVANWSRALRFWERYSRLPWNGSRILEIGGRSGGLARWMASRGAEVLCTDIEFPEGIPEPCEDDSGGRIEYRLLNALEMDFSETFDRIVFKSVLGGIGRNGHPEWQQTALNKIHQALKPGGELLFAENLTGSPLHRFLRRKFVRWGREWRYVSIQEMLEFLDHFNSVDYHTAGFLGAFGRSERLRNILGSLDRATDRFVPRTWRYIIMGVAHK